MEKTAPFASIAIPLSLGSITGLKYKTLSCVECGHPILERSSDRMFRISSKDMPEEARIGADGTIPAICGRCTQKYSITISLGISTKVNDIPLYMQPQSMFITVSPTKKLRDVHCLECGKAFYSVSDRINLMTDNTVPLEMINPLKLGPMEVWCKFHHCKQRWSVMA